MAMGAHRRRRGGAALAALSVIAVAASGLSSPHVSDLRLSTPEGALEIGAVRTNATWLGVALAQAADLTLENVTFAAAGATYRLPRVVFSGSSLSRADLVALFDAREAAGARLARLSAREVSIPELRIEQASTGGRQITVYRDLVARDITGGRIASLTSGGATLEMTGAKAGMAKGSAGAMVVRSLDLAYAAELYGRTASPTAAARTVYASFALDDLAVSEPNGAEVRIARLSGTDFKARPSATSWGDSMRILGEAQDIENASPAERSRLFGILADLFESFELGSTEATGIEMRNARAKEQPVGRIARLAVVGGGARQPAEARAEGLEIVSSNGTARIEAIAFAGFSMTDALKGLAERPADKLDPADLRKLVPLIGTIRFTGLDVDAKYADLANGSSKAAGPDAIRFGIRGIEMTADKPIDGVPTNLRLAFENVTFAVPPNAQDDGLKTLAALGYGALDLSLVTAASWNEAGNELVVREVSVSGADMGSAVLRGVLADVGRDVINLDSAVAAAALVGARARNLHLTLENKGLFERVIASESRKAKKSPEELRREYGMAAAIAVPAMLGNAPAARTLGQAVARFVAKPGRLTISMTAKDPAGLGIADLAATPEPAAILDKLEITATAE
ncbi:MAG TPA: hypothetical protein VFY72_06840 [Beijerinckiaceae bacterium]|nr:hypothetical protein [Beijerinckiaceae bacterium]